MRRPGRQRRQRQRPEPTPQELAAKRLKGLYQRWGSPTPPTGREVFKIVARGNESRLKSRQRTRRKESTAASFRARKARQLRRWQVGREDMGGRVVTPTAKSRPAAVIEGREREKLGWASKGPATTLTPALAGDVQRLRGEGHTIAVIAETVGHPPATVARWLRTGRAAAVAAVLEGQHYRTTNTR